jgi:hypothetical protein
MPPFERPTLDAAYWLSANTQIWLLWIAGGALIVASWLRWLTRRAGWLGLATVILGALASSTPDETARRALILAGAGVVLAMLIMTALRGELRPRRIAPGDYETELVALCGGNRRRAERLIRDEMKRQRGLSRAGAALAVVTRLRHERDPLPPAL